MPKRGADKQITKDNHEEDGDDEEVPTEQAVASEEKLAQRKIVKVKRKVTTGESAPIGAKFSFADAASESKKPAAAAAAASAPAAAAAGAAAPKTGFFSHFSAGMWECPDCMLQNKPGVAKCPACTCPNPNMAQEPKGKSSEEQAVADAGISFGGGDSAPASAAAPAAAAAGSESIFGTSVAGFGADAGFAFGGGASFGDMPSSDSSALTAANPDFAAATTAPSDAPNPAAAQFVGKKAESSGEEKDSTVYTTKCKVYLLKLVPKNVKESALPKDDDDAAKEDKPASNGAKAGAAAAAAAGDSDEKEQKYVEIGSGDLKVNKFTKEDGSAGARMVLRAEKVQRLVVNAPIFDGMSYAIQNEKYVRFISMGLASDSEPAKLQAHLLRFKSKAEATDVHTHITQLIASLKGKK